MTNVNTILDTDSYKFSHYLQYPPKTTSMFSYIESRGGQFPETVFFGLQYILKNFLSRRITVEEVEEAKAFVEMHGEPFNYEGWMYIAKELNGKIPVRIRAVPEGTVVPTHNVLLTIESTDPKVYWIVSWVETMLMRIWYPTTVATQSFFIKKLIFEYLCKTSDDPKSGISFALHDFGSRGVSSRESAMIGGAAHLVNFLGSDTVVGVWCANKFYNEKMAGFSIPAAEHSSITSWGKENEVAAYRNMLRQFAKPNGLVAIVSDSYDLWNAITNLWGGELRKEVIESGATVVIRPDSGHPPSVVLKSAQLLDEKFGSKINGKGYKVLNNVKIIQGDGINIDSIKEILEVLTGAGYSATNIAFGMGGGLLQSPNRDTNRFAMKCSSITVNGKMIDVFKDPITDKGKKSKAGRLDLICSRHAQGNDPNDIQYATVNIGDKKKHLASIMRTVFLNGDILVEDTFAQIRKRVSVNIGL